MVELGLLITDEHQRPASWTILFSDEAIVFAFTEVAVAEVERSASHRLRQKTCFGIHSVRYTVLAKLDSPLSE